MKRRAFLSTTPGLLGGIGLQSSTLLHPRKDRLLEAMEQSVLRRSLFPDPIIIKSVELLRYQDLKMSPKNCAYPLPVESSKEASIISFGCWVKMH
jgi:hypothetical protein